tara:strand:+ start:798 stop:908 length:111 start_codon:yes stop_codon:yes gene_type:complete
MLAPFVDLFEFAVKTEQSHSFAFEEFLLAAFVYPWN